MQKECNPLDLEDYRYLINLDKRFEKKEVILKNQKDKEILVDRLLDYLILEMDSKRTRNFAMDASHFPEKREQLYKLLTLHPPYKFPKWFYQCMNQLLQTELKERNMVEVTNLPLISQSIAGTKFSSASKCALWKGDITNLRIDAIVNAANRKILGCFHPFHKCIDNAIHTAAGPQLREDCSIIMNKQSCLEETGWAKITRAYNLPSKYILHTVGPIIKRNQEFISVEKENLLADCYFSCLSLASRMKNIRSIAFCSISTGVFGFPIKAAASIATRTVNEWLENNPEAFDLIVFNVFSENDYEVFKSAL
ncbi:MAG: protein-ADP-ribose hydrolase [Candidatus Heimdallarchaeota archaeon]|nr:protein-ADP-ribose hydrolase [Candidatus Heimdallarchaeota archaeon]